MGRDDDSWFSSCRAVTTRAYSNQLSCTAASQKQADVATSITSNNTEPITLIDIWTAIILIQQGGGSRPPNLTSSNARCNRQPIKASAFACVDVKHARAAAWRLA